jgi:hypothetical protein
MIHALGHEPITMHDEPTQALVLELQGVFPALGRVVQERPGGDAIERSD